MSLLNLSGTYDDETCLSRLSISAETNESIVAGHRCGVVWDSFLCWGPAFPGSTVYSPCPAAKGMDVTKQAFRRCDSSGSWLNQKGLPDERGWTNYTPCFTPEILSLLKRLYTGSEDEAMTKIEIARRTRILEIVGLSLSLTALVLSLFIFYYFRSLRNPRTRLHRHLFIAMVIQVAVRLTLYIDQFVVRSYSDVTEAQQEGHNARGIDNTPILCEAAYICLEYARTAMFMWMFVEGLYLHNMITVTVFEEKLSPSIYPLVGWVFPMPLTLSWAIVTAKHYGAATCWWGYNFTVYFWILEGPRLGVLMVNLAFLLNILRVLVTKLRQSNSSEAHQARKAVKAALVLLPLLGLTNLVNMLEAPLERSALEFGLWAYTAHALNSCQGLILACLYCFWNGEVQLALKKFMRYKIFNGTKYRGGGTPNGRAGSLRMSLMNNSGGRNQGTVVAAGGRQTPLQENNQQRNDSGAGQGSISPPSQHIRLSKVLQATNDIHVEIEPTRSSCDDSSSTSSPIHSGPRSQKSSKYSHTTSSCTLGSAHESASNKFKRFSKLRIWISPLMFASNEAARKSRSSYNNEPTNLSVPEIRIKDEDEEENELGGDEEKDDDDDDDEGIAEEVEEPEGEELEVVGGETLCSTEGCHFRIEVEEDVEEVK